eukprot:CAMPEP_0169117472 /NCGR_PEP_ID=MMETSP1015-20121227/30478_1 /TAXON_ID=342587 /ORGANISM="Karlodinium micrum, Strain CCMP2283" /LENGTH=175 /DNA_ID=CAMNT_0009180161 /DNA_START=61 /DNA_END=588 /DNA_ORIENTATION=+
MQRIAFVLSCLAFGHGQRLEISTEIRIESAEDSEQALASFLLASNPSATSSVSIRQRTYVHPEPQRKVLPRTRKAVMSAELEEMLSSADVVFFDMATCPFCAKARGALKDAGIDFKLVPIAEYKPALIAATGKSSAPSVWIKGKYVGGCNDGPEDWQGVLPMLKNGLFEKMMKED